MQNNLPKLTLFYDGRCPLCQAEILFLSKRNQRQLLDFVDIHTDAFQPQAMGVTCDQAMAAMYGQLDDGRLFQGAPVFALAYQRANLPLLAWFLSLKPLQPVFQWGYRLFARNRYTLSKWLGPLALRLVRGKSRSHHRSGQ
jgi:predicted DCC family thiol-disulfide oxidoreductase YuxK